MDKYTDAGFVDSFRMFEDGPDHYTWWSYRPGVREKNVGWRIDYFWSNNDFLKKAKFQGPLFQKILFFKKCATS